MPDTYPTFTRNFILCKGFSCVISRKPRRTLRLCLSGSTRTGNDDIHWRTAGHLFNQAEPGGCASCGRPGKQGIWRHWDFGHNSPLLPLFLSRASPSALDAKDEIKTIPLVMPHHYTTILYNSQALLTERFMLELHRWRNLGGGNIFANYLLPGPGKPRG